MANELTKTRVDFKAAQEAFLTVMNNAINPFGAKAFMATDDILQIQLGNDYLHIPRKQFENIDAAAFIVEITEQVKKKKEGQKCQTKMEQGREVVQEDQETGEEEAKEEQLERGLEEKQEGGKGIADSNPSSNFI